MVLSNSAANISAPHLDTKRSDIAEIQQQIEQISEQARNSTTSLKSIADVCLARITRLAGQVADASDDIPSYDQRSYNETVKSLQDKLAQIQAQHAPKSKFSFKSKRSTPTPPVVADGQKAIPEHVMSSLGLHINSDSSSRSITPVHLQNLDQVRSGNTPVPTDPMPVLQPTIDQSPRTGHEGPATSAILASSTNTRAEPDTSLEITNRTNSIVTISPHPTTNTLSSSPPTCTISNIKSSHIHILPSSTATALDSLSRSTFASLTLTDTKSSLLTILTAIQGPAHITNVQDSILVLRSIRQFRMHHCSNVTVYLFCTSRPIIEDCHGIKFARVPGVVSETSGFVQQDEARNKFDEVDDFKWLRAEHSPNWCLLKDEDGLGDDMWRDVLQVSNHSDGSESVRVNEILEKVKLN